jgi:hypothetical protein
MTRSVKGILALLAAALLAAVAVSSSAAATCGAGSYSYAGVGSKTATSGVSATIRPTATPNVRDGHVSGWIGVGGVGAGPNGMDEWIQIGVTANPGDTTSRIYYEIARPGRSTVYRELSHRVGVGEAHWFAVLELAGRPGWWRVSLDGLPISAPVFLPESHAKWNAQMIGESAGGATSGACNLYAYAFGDVSLASAGSGAWGTVGPFHLFQDPFYRLVRKSATSFVARSVTTPARTPVSTP